MAANNGVAVIAVDPAYTSRWAPSTGLEHLGQISPEASGHHAAALVIGRPRTRTSGTTTGKV